MTTDIIYKGQFQCTHICIIA